MIKTQVNKIITEYCKENNISKKKYSLYPLYIHLNGFSHAIGFINHRANKNVKEYNYTSVGYSHYDNDDCWGFENDHQRNITKLIFANIPHYSYQNNAKEILF